MSVRKSSHGTIFLIVSSGSPRALIASSLRSTSKKPFYPMTRSLHPPMTACGHRVRFVATWREEFFEVPATPPCRRGRAQISEPWHGGQYCCLKGRARNVLLCKRAAREIFRATRTPRQGG